jgi:hypoxanthine phosphoribosyltransferase
MNCVELSIKSLEEHCNNWAITIGKTVKPDAVVYIAKAGYLIGKIFSLYFNCPLYGINTERFGNQKKAFLAPIFKYCPQKLRNYLIWLELKTNIHNHNSKREIIFLDEPCFYIKKGDVLVVDDSVDTGNSLKSVVDVIQNKNPNFVIHTAGLNVWDKSESLIHTDFALYRNTIIKSPMSKDSKEYKDFLSIYNASRKDLG